MAEKFEMADKAVVAVGPGTRSIALGKNRVRLIVTLGRGCPVSVVDYPLPPGGKVLALSGIGPTAVTEDGTMWEFTDNKWERVGSLRDSA